MLSTQLEECDELSLVDWSDRVNCFDFHHHGIFHKNVEPESKIDPLAVVVHWTRQLCRGVKAALVQFIHQTHLVNVFEQSGLQGRMDFHGSIYDSAADFVECIPLSPP